MEEDKKIENLIATLYIYTELKRGYPVRSCLVRMQSKFVDLVEKIPTWKDKTKHPIMRDEKLRAIILFDDDAAKVDYERKSSTEYRNETEEIKISQAALKTTMARIQKELAQMKEEQTSNKNKKKD